MPLTRKQISQAALQRLMQLEATLPVAEAAVDALPLRLPAESYRDWLKRGQKMSNIIPFPQMNFRYLTDVHRLAADSGDHEDALPEIPLLSDNQQFRLTVDVLPDNRLKLTLETLGLACSRYANQLIGIAASESKDQLISIMRLDADGDGVDDTLDNTAAVRHALLHPVIALIGQDDA